MLLKSRDYRPQRGLKYPILNDHQIMIAEKMLLGWPTFHFFLLFLVVCFDVLDSFVTFSSKCQKLNHHGIYNDLSQLIQSYITCYS